MAPGRSPDHLAEALPRCTDPVARYGAGHPFALDCLVRHLLDTGWPGALALGHDPAAGELVIQAGIGCLRVGPEAMVYQSAAKPVPGAEPRPAPPALAAARLSACGGCSSWADGRCSAAGCGCAGLGRADLLSSRCPLGRWTQGEQREQSAKSDA